MAYAHKGLRELAIEQFTEAVRLRPDLLVARLDLTTLLLEMQRPHAALDALQPLLTTISQDAEDSGRIAPAEVHYRLGIAYCRRANRPGLAARPSGRGPGSARG